MCKPRDTNLDIFILEKVPERDYACMLYSTSQTVSQLHCTALYTFSTQTNNCMHYIFFHSLFPLSYQTKRAINISYTHSRNIPSHSISHNFIPISITSCIHIDITQHNTMHHIPETPLILFYFCLLFNPFLHF